MSEQGSDIIYARTHSQHGKGHNATLLGWLGERFANKGDLEKARNYLREAIRVTTEEDRRARFCGMLAWLEDDPEIAGALLEQSFAGLDKVPNGENYALHSLELAVVTGSDELAEYCFQHYKELLWPDYPFGAYVGRFPETHDWLLERLGPPEPLP